MKELTEKQAAKRLNELAQEFAPIAQKMKEHLRYINLGGPEKEISLRMAVATDAVARIFQEMIFIFCKDDKKADQVISQALSASREDAVWMKNQIWKKTTLNE